MSTRRVVRERIDPRLTAALFSNYRSPVDAVLELIDNAVDSRLPGRALQVDVGLRPGTITLVATGGQGMGPRQLEREHLRWVNELMLVSLSLTERRRRRRRRTLQTPVQALGM